MSMKFIISALAAKRTLLVCKYISTHAFKACHIFSLQILSTINYIEFTRRYDVILPIQVLRKMKLLFIFNKIIS